MFDVDGVLSDAVGRQHFLEHGRRGPVESRDEHVVDQILHCLAAAAMRERHLRHEHPAERTGSLGGRGKSHVAASCFFNPPY